MAMYAKVRRLKFRDGLSICEIARRTSLSRNTIKAWLRGADRNAMKYRRPSGKTKLDEHVDWLRRAMEIDQARPKRDRRTVLRLHAQLRNQGFTGSYTPSSGRGSAIFVDMPQAVFRWDSLTFGRIPYMSPPSVRAYTLDVVYHSHPFSVCFRSCMPGSAPMGPSAGDGEISKVHPTAFHVIQQAGGHTYYYGPRALDEE